MMVVVLTRAWGGTGTGPTGGAGCGVGGAAALGVTVCGASCGVVECACWTGRAPPW